MNEASKIKAKILPYLQGRICDIGCGDEKIIPEAIGVDGRVLPGVNYVTDDLYTLHFQPFYNQPFDVVFSSHLLEHLASPYEALASWGQLLRVGGYLILYLPEATAYDNYENPEHLMNWRYEDFLFWFRRCFCGESHDFRGRPLPAHYELIESGLDVGEDRYSFYLIAKKLI